MRKNKNPYGYNKKKKNTGKKIALIVSGIIILILVLIFVTGNGYLFSALKKTFLKGYTTSNIDDHTDFENNIIPSGEPQYWDYHAQYGKIHLSKELRSELEDFESIGFAVFVGGKMLYEEYWDGYSNESYTNSFSMSKSITSLLLGKALKDGYIKSVDQSITEFLPEFQGDENARLCTIRNLVTMTSGFDWDENYYSPLNSTTEAYYGKGIEKQLLKRKFKHKPGGLFKYSSADTQLLGIILKRATGKSLSQYLSESFWKPMGMETNALWSISGGIEKTFCCVHSNVRDFAKLGQLLLQHGKWNGEQLVDSAYVAKMIHPYHAAFSKDYPERYGYGIWMDEKYSPPLYAMLGHLGQRVIVVPQHELVIVRLGKIKNTKRESPGVLDADVYFFVDEILKILPKNQ